VARYLLLFRSGSQPQSEDEGKAVMAAWTAWFERLGPAVVDGGNPTAGGRSIGPDGAVSDAAVADVTGYSILEADSLDSAVQMSVGCPHLDAGGTVTVLETMEVM
jgi:hypothetical protein